MFGILFDKDLVYLYIGIICASPLSKAQTHLNSTLGILQRHIDFSKAKLKTPSAVIKSQASFAHMTNSTHGSCAYPSSQEHMQFMIGPHGT